ncbi:MAG: bifunctional 4-hydroxy-2-oxoglutarate aldolase/2-dehydro-3-deoxy-phosphogluconate aldolase [Bifidobacteriaceae bacterium]|jgi:2-dehydro-3-deoxyphosphogluconate aldolase/(4S)-4-hydroxy-2-oxoglutarate aldolase|nr:bifunctional 4-hydroxy-2-oxoglutarate aldolase/2-dehydro-3-deoxy-phosphogluconate aldolase [Bifidobacteriaceae bacterium]
MSAQGFWGRHRVIPLVVMDRAEDATPTAEALAEGGLPIIEVAYRTPKAQAVVRRLARMPGLVVGAGTVVNEAQAEGAVDAGAQFLVSPGFAEWMQRVPERLGVPLLPGVATPGETMRAYDAGFDTMKLFPASVLGGVDAVSALASAFPGARFIPTGGVTAANAVDYLNLPEVAAVGGSWIAPKPLISAGDFAQITQLAREAIELSEVGR